MGEGMELADGGCMKFIVLLIAAFASIACQGNSSDAPAECTPECGDATCGDDGCGGSCGECPTGTACAFGACSACGNGVVDDGETCDASAGVECPREELCESDDGCFIADYLGSPDTCDAACNTTQVVECASGDRCCPTGCNPGNDVDCALESCGNGTLDTGEACDASAGTTGACPTECARTDACETAEFWGYAEACTLTCMRETITSCRAEADGCCPEGCTDQDDGDCNPAVCGDGVVTGDEACDSGLTWPAPGSCSPDCDDHRSCTIDLMNGGPATCDVACTAAPITDCVSADGCCPIGCVDVDDDCLAVVCGDGNVDGAEGCDNAIPPGEPGACPLDASACDDGDPCTDDSVAGDAADCSAHCVNEPRPCGSGDGCCPYDCTADSDAECAALDLCNTYCFAATTYCTGPHELYASTTDCDIACGSMPIGHDGDASGDSVYCRIHHLADAQADPEGHCVHGAAEPLGGCE